MHVTPVCGVIDTLEVGVLIGLVDPSEEGSAAVARFGAVVEVAALALARADEAGDPIGSRERVNTCMPK